MLDHILTTKYQLGAVSVLDHSPTPSEFENLLQAYLLSCKVEEKSLNTVDTYCQRIGAFLKFQRQILFHQSLKDIPRNDIRLYLLSLREKKLNGSTINSHYRAIKTFFNWLLAEGFISESPMENIKPPQIPKTRPRPFSRQDIDNLLLLCSGNKFLDLRNRAIILMFLDTALRVAELAGIQLSDVNFDRETITVMGKGAKERVVRIGKTAQKALLRYLLSRNDSRPCLWVTEERRPLARAGIQITIKRLCRRAGIIDAKPGAHTFRHTAAICCLRNGMGEFALQVMLGHATLAMTRKYTQALSSEDAVIAHRLASPVDRLGIK